jgi:hypothetical protein
MSEITVSPNLVAMLGDYLQKTGSLSTDVASLASRTEALLDKESQEKQASLGIAKERAEQVAYLLSQTRLPTGQNFIEGPESLKIASQMLSDHGHALNLLELVLNHVTAASKTASFDIGRPVDGPKKQALSAEDELRQDVRSLGA